jgi:chromosomal replication initiator protein
MELSATDLWTRVLDAARSALPEQTFRTWLAGSSAQALTEEELLIQVGSPFHVEWIEDKYGMILTEIAERVLGRPIRLAYQAPTGRLPAPSLPTVAMDPAPPSHAPAASNSRSHRDGSLPALNERYTFDRFVVGSNNELAAAACNAVAEKPARMYNPLFLYGGVGLGKTHLMHAIGNHLLAGDRGRRVAYVPTEEFMNQLVNSIQQGSTGEFRRRYRQIDLLLVDDVHFLEGKERTQEEFFHTFNALYDAGKQIVLTSDRPPKDIPGLEERLVSRFEWGLVADIKPPDYETRVAILRKKASDDRLTLDSNVLDFIARACTASVRELEGAVIKLLAYSSLTHQEITLSLARAALQGVIRPGVSDLLPGPTPERIRELVAASWQVTPQGLASKKRTKELTVPRQAAMYLIRDMLDLPLVQIGDLFGGRDHSTVIHSVRVVEHRLGTDPEFRARMDDIRTELRRIP